MTNLTIKGFKDKNFSSNAPPPNVYVAMLNPTSIDLTTGVDFSDKDSGTSGASPKFKQVRGDTLSFELIIDCTGVVDATRLSLKTELDTLTSVMRNYQGNIHRSNYVTVAWGNTLNFRGVLTNMNVNYTFFKPNGAALRAKVKLDFRSYVDAATLAKQQNPKSPDVTHHILVRDGDSLPQIAHTVYHRPEFFVALARANNLDKFRYLPGGTNLLTPPLKTPGGANG